MKIPVAIKTIQDTSGRQTFTEITDVRMRPFNTIKNISEIVANVSHNIEYFEVEKLNGCHKINLSMSLYSICCP